MRKSVVTSIIILSCIYEATYAQYNKVLNSNIASLQVVAGNNWLSVPIISLTDNTPINIDFDELSHDNKRYAYKIEHCEADWAVSDGIFESDFCEGFADGNVIDDIHESTNTNTLYTHYRLTIPNEKCKIKLSGNYRVGIYDENDGDTILYASFMVVDPKVSAKVKVSTNTDIDTNKEHQQVSLSVGYDGLDVSTPTNEIKTIITQNGCWHDARYNIKPQRVRPGVLEWEHNRLLIFDGGNEYHKFEIIDVAHPTLGVESTHWDGNEYYASLWPTMPSRNYVYDEDANGAFYIRNNDNVENNIASEYINVSFRLKTPNTQDSIFIDGVWTNGELNEKYQMVYNPAAQLYEKQIKLKQGYYSYRYVTKKNSGVVITPLSSDGNFHQTENSYQAFVYYRGIGQRTDQLVGYQNITTR